MWSLTGLMCAERRMGIPIKLVGFTFYRPRGLSGLHASVGDHLGATGRTLNGGGARPGRDRARACSVGVRAGLAGRGGVQELHGLGQEVGH